MAKKSDKAIGLTEEPIATVKGFKCVASIAEGWRVTQADKDRLLMVHPDFSPRIVELRSIEEGDVLPRATDEILEFSNKLGGK